MNDAEQPQGGCDERVAEGASRFAALTGFNATADTLRAHLPVTWAAFRDGTMSFGKAQIIADQVRVLAEHPTTRTITLTSLRGVPHDTDPSPF